MHLLGNMHQVMTILALDGCPRICCRLEVPVAVSKLSSYLNSSLEVEFPILQWLFLNVLVLGYVFRIVWGSVLAKKKHCRGSAESPQGMVGTT
jgi:hypothetical protein